MASSRDGPIEPAAKAVGGGRLPRIVVPTAFVASLLYYYGYTYSQSFYDALGLNVDSLGLSTFDFAVRSSQILIQSASTLVGVLAGMVALHLLSCALVAVAQAHVEGTPTWPQLLLGGVWGLAGVVLLVPVHRPSSESAASFRTMLGILALSYALWWLAEGIKSYDWIRRLERVMGVTAATLTRLLALSTIVVWLIYGLFEYTRVGAHDVGQQRAVWVEQNCTLYARVAILSTVDLQIDQPGVRTTVSTTQGGGFRYRYEGFRILNQRAGQYLLWPTTRSPRDGLMSLPADSRTRLETVPSGAGQTCPTSTNPLGSG